MASQYENKGLNLSPHHQTKPWSPQLPDIYRLLLKVRVKKTDLLPNFLRHVIFIYFFFPLFHVSICSCFLVCVKYNMALRDLQIIVLFFCFFCLFAVIGLTSRKIQLFHPSFTSGNENIMCGWVQQQP